MNGRDLRIQAQNIDAALVDGIRFSVEQMGGMRGLVDQKQRDIVLMEKLLKDLEDGIQLKNDPLKVALTRLDNRSYRPRMELCFDAAQESLLEEIRVLQEAIRGLEIQLGKFGVLSFVTFYFSFV